MTARIGLWLGVCFGVAFLTGLISHVAQDPPGWLSFPSRPVWLYRVTQGLHVTAGMAAVPLLLVKLWSVYPRLFRRADRRGRRSAVVDLAERGSIAVLVAAGVFQLVTGLANSAQWYPWFFGFRDTHYAIAWVAVGAILIHVAVKLPVIRSALSAPLDDNPVATRTASGLSRRTVLRATWLASAAAVMTTAGATVPLLRGVSVFATHTGDGPQGLPVNKTARSAGVAERATDPAYRLTLVNGDRRVELSRSDLERLAQRSADLPIACVEGWSASGRWQGVRMSDLLALVGAPADSDLRFESLQRTGGYARIVLPRQFARDPLTLLALRLNGEPLALDHGFPCRLIAPNRPGALQQKWVAAITVLR